jgi:isocitrate dehydrogenase kinase/phosphatase
LQWGKGCRDLVAAALGSGDLWFVNFVVSADGREELLYIGSEEKAKMMRISRWMKQVG